MRLYNELDGQVVIIPEWEIKNIRTHVYREINRIADIYIIPNLPLQKAEKEGVNILDGGNVAIRIISSTDTSSTAGTADITFGFNVDQSLLDGLFNDTSEHDLGYNRQKLFNLLIVLRDALALSNVQRIHRQLDRAELSLRRDDTRIPKASLTPEEALIRFKELESKQNAVPSSMTIDDLLEMRITRQLATTRPVAGSSSTTSSEINGSAPSQNAYKRMFSTGYTSSLISHLAAAARIGTDASPSTRARTAEPSVITRPQESGAAAVHQALDGDSSAPAEENHDDTPRPPSR